MKTRNTMAPSYHSKVSSTQNRRISFSFIPGLSQSFSDNSNQTNLVDNQRLHENSKLILCVSNRVYILFKRSFLTASHCFIKLFRLQQN